MTLPSAIDFSTIISLSAGALIAGLVGISATLLDKRISRREEHRKKLMDNLMRVQQFLKTPMFTIWPPLQIGYSGLELPIPWSAQPEDRIIFIENEAVDFLKCYSITAPRVQLALSTSRDDENVRVRRELVHDLKNHFPQLHSDMLDWEETVRDTGSGLRVKFYSVVSTIYHELVKRDLIIYTNKQAVASPLEITNNLALAIQVMFNLVLGIPTTMWFNTYQIYLDSPDRDAMNDIIESLSFQFDAKSVMSEVNSMLQKLDKLWNEMEAIAVSDRRLRGRCRLS